MFLTHAPFLLAINSKVAWSESALDDFVSREKTALGHLYPFFPNNENSGTAKPWAIGHLSAFHKHIAMCQAQHLTKQRFSHGHFSKLFIERLNFEWISRYAAWPNKLLQHFVNKHLQFLRCLTFPVST